MQFLKRFQGPRFRKFNRLLNYLVCNTYRFRAHSMFDAELYRDKSEVEEWKKRDPILKLQQHLSDKNVIVQDEFDALIKRADREIQEAVDFAEAGTLEPLEELHKFVYIKDSNL